MVVTGSPASSFRARSFGVSRPSLVPDVRQFRHQYLTQMASTSKVPLQELEKKWKVQHRKIRDALYKEALEEAGLDGK